MIQIPRLFLEEAVPLLPAARDAVPVLLLAFDDLLWALWFSVMGWIGLLSPPAKAQDNINAVRLPQRSAAGLAPALRSRIFDVRPDPVLFRRRSKANTGIAIIQPQHFCDVDPSICTSLC